MDSVCVLSYRLIGWLVCVCGYVRTALLTSLIHSSVIFPVDGLTHNVKNTYWLQGLNFKCKNVQISMSSSNTLYKNLTKKLLSNGESSNKTFGAVDEPTLHFVFIHLLCFVSTWRLKSRTTLKMSS